MNNIRLDLAKKYTHICEKNEAGEIISEKKLKTAELEEYFGLIPRSKIALETCENAWAVARLAKAKNHEVFVVAASTVKMLGVGAHGTKTDKRDARVMADALVLPQLKSVHVPSKNSEALKDELQARAALVDGRKNLVLVVKAGYRRKLTPVTRTVESLPRKVCEFHSTEEADDENLDVEEMIQQAAIPEYVKSLLELIRMANKHILLADKRISKLAEEDSVCQLLMSGVGPNVSLAFRAAIDEAQRFKTGAQVASYLGLAPGEKSTGGRTVRTGITKCGNENVRRLLVMAAHVHLMQGQTTAMGDWAKNLALKRGKLRAVTALARKLATIMLAIWKSGKKYDATLGATALPPLKIEEIRKAIWRKVPVH